MNINQIAKDISYTAQTILFMLPLKDNIRLKEPERYNLPDPRNQIEENKESNSSIDLDLLLNNYKRINFNSQAKLSSLFNSLKREKSENKLYGSENIILSSNSESREDSELDDKFPIQKSISCLVNVVNSLSMLKSNQKKKILDQNEKQQILLSSKTASKILCFDSKHYDIEIEKLNKEVLITFKCKYSDCRREFNKAQNFVVHLKMHLGIKKYSCEFCEKQFSQKGNMK